MLSIPTAFTCGTPLCWKVFGCSRTDNNAAHAEKLGLSYARNVIAQLVRCSLPFPVLISPVDNGGSHPLVSYYLPLPCTFLELIDWWAAIFSRSSTKQNKIHITGTDNRQTSNLIMIAEWRVAKKKNTNNSLVLVRKYSKSVYSYIDIPLKL